MKEVLRILIGTFALLIGFFIGDFLAKITKEELIQGQKWFKAIILFSLLFGSIGFAIRNDVLMFSFFFIAIVTSRSIITSKRK